MAGVQNYNKNNKQDGPALCGLFIVREFRSKLATAAIWHIIQYSSLKASTADQAQFTISKLGRFNNGTRYR